MSEVPLYQPSQPKRQRKIIQAFSRTAQLFKSWQRTATNTADGSSSTGAEAWQKQTEDLFQVHLCKMLCFTYNTRRQFLAGEVRMVVKARARHRGVERGQLFGTITRKVDVRLPGKGNSNSHGARPVHLIITMIKWIRTTRLSIKKSLSAPSSSRGGAEEGGATTFHTATIPSCAPPVRTCLV